MKEKEILPPHINLVGDSIENFYGLGLKDKETAPQLISHMKSLTKTPWDSVNKMAYNLSKTLIKQMFLRSPVFKDHIVSYADGLGRDPEEIALCYVIPEVVSSMDKWLPSAPFGCSSFFMLDEKNSCPIHGRILDFPLIGSYDVNSRTINYNFLNSPQIFAYSSSGLAHPSLTSMNSEGVSFAIHQKFTNNLNPSGTPIFELIYQMLKNCNDLSSTLAYLKHIKSITAWAFHMSFSNGDILAVDIKGDQKDIHTYKIEENKILYFNNELLTKCSKNYLPYGFSDYNQMRQESAAIINKKLLKKEKRTDLDLLMAMACPAKLYKNENASQYLLSPITPSSLDIICMTPKIEKSISIHTSAPKYYRGEYLENTNVFSNHKRKIKNGPKVKTHKKLMDGVRECMKAQAAIDQDKIEEAYHHFQIGIDLLEQRSEKTIAEFFFYTLRFCHETHPKTQRSILKKFLSLNGQLPEYLNSQLLLFIRRLEIILNKKSHITIDQIKVEALKKVYRVEERIPDFLLHKTITKLMSIRYDILDFIYPHAVS